MRGKRAKKTKVSDSNDDIGGFEQFKIKWTNEGTHLTFDTDDALHFYGWYRQTRVSKTGLPIHSVDLYVKREASEDGRVLDVCVDSLVYDTDPRENIRSLNADICAATNRWFHQNFAGKAESIDALFKQAKYPTIHVERIQTIDFFIQKLKEFRNVAISSGGTRLLELKGDRDTPPLLISINVTDQAMALKGKIPTLEQGALIDRALTRKRGEELRGEKIVNVGNPENVQVILDHLKETKDKAQQRKLRAILRSMGHRGGVRGN